MTETILTDDAFPQPKSEDDVSQFMRDIRKYPLLTPEQEREIALLCAKGDTAAIRTMVNSNLRLVVSIAREFAGRGIPLLDLIQEGSLGLLAAAKKFDPTMETRFSTYATKWIRQGIDRAVLNQSGMIRVPLHTMEKIRKLIAVRDALREETGRKPETWEIAQRSGIPEKKVEEYLANYPEVGSLNVPVGEDGEDPLQVLVENTRAAQPEESLVRKELERTVNKVLEMLDPRQQLLLRLRFGMEDGVCHSLQQIADHMDVSKERVRQLERQALDKLQQLGAGVGLEDFLK